MFCKQGLERIYFRRRQYGRSESQNVAVLPTFRFYLWKALSRGRPLSPIFFRLSPFLDNPQHSFLVGL
jgi:hypothetical protein